MAIYFLADIHLAEHRPAITAAFLDTLAAIAGDAEAVYILGDLYDYWLGDDLASPFHQRIAAALAALPCPVYYQHGNRDFLLGAAYARAAHLHLLPERYRLQLGDTPVLLEHGDLLCTDDRGYQHLRRVLRCRPLQWLYYRLPRALRRRLAEKLRQQSQARTRRKASAITDTHPAAIRTALENAAATVLIHGHTHRPAVHHLDDGNTVYVLGDWRPYGEILRYADGTFTLADCRANCGRIAVF